jgi:predicted alpha/beta superfamily hydrolase
VRAWVVTVLAGVSLVMACGPAGDEGDAQQSDELRAKTTTLLVHYPAGYGHAITVHCGGGSQTWSKAISASWTSGDVWKATVSTSVAIECKPLFDNQTWAIGPNWKIAAGKTVDLWPHFFHDAGTIQQIDNWYSHILNDSRGIWIYRPPSYDENPNERFPVVYMHDGQNLFYDSAAFGGTSWNAGGAMDQGARDGSIHEAIVIGIDNNADRMSEYTPVSDPDYGGGNADAYLAFVIQELKPQMDANLRTLPDAAHTAIIGSSLGGLVSAYAGLHHADVFGRIGALSPSTWWDNTWIIGQTQQASGTLPARVYVDSGDAGNSNDDVTDTAQLAQAWKAKSGVTVDYLVQSGGQHNEYYWRQRLPGALSFLLGGR